MPAWVAPATPAAQTVTADEAPVVAAPRPAFNPAPVDDGARPATDADDAPHIDRVFPHQGSDIPFVEDEDERPARRNPARLWTIAAIAFALIIGAAAAGLSYFGPPAWAVSMGLFPASANADALVFFDDRVERRPLAGGSDGEEIFAIGASIRNRSSATIPVPPIVIELRDAQNRLVFSWSTKADKASLKPGEVARIAESRVDIPKTATTVSFSFAEFSR